METRASHFVVGIFVLLSAIGLAGFGAWLAKTKTDQAYDLYDVSFRGSVNGLQEGSSVLYRGVPVGRVSHIAIDRDNITRVLATIEVQAGTPIKEDTSAQLAIQGITGIASIELLGGSNDSADVEPGEDGRPPKLEAAPSAIEKFVQSTPELLANTSAMVDRISVLLSDENIQAFTTILEDLAKTAATLAENRGEFTALLEEVASASTNASDAAAAAKALMPDIQAALAAITQRSGAIGDSAETTLAEFGETSKAVKNLAWRMDRIFGELERPLDDFGQTGMYDFSEMVREMRQLVASLSRITTEFERDPAGFLIGGNQRGFVPE
ncbi:MAG: MCE family protein [Geminicoccaceae bacterium]|nr:MCE family protein [Geminicoccaceae bacterium]